MNRSWHIRDDLGRVRAQVQKAGHVLLALDYDGTLSPIAGRPEDARVDPETLAFLRLLAGSDGISLAIVSGRSVADLKRRLPFDLTLVGNHGLEVEGPLVSFVHPGATNLRQVLDHACWDLEAALDAVRGVFVERKGLSATVHFRQAPVELCAWIEATVNEIIRPYLSRLYIAPALRAWEIRPRLPWNKGSALKLILDRMIAPRPALICAGDDVTDEDMFDASPDAISIHVGPVSRTQARYFVQGTDELLQFLRVLAVEAKVAPVRPPINGAPTDCSFSCHSMGALPEARVHGDNTGTSPSREQPT